MPDFYTSPDTRNLTISEGKVYWKEDGTSTYIDLGDASNFKYTLSGNSLDHKTHRGGVSVINKAVPTDIAAKISLSLDEMTPSTFALWGLGTVVTATDGSTYVDLVTNTTKSGTLKFLGTNSYGPKATWIGKVILQPSGDAAFIQENDGYMSLPVEGKVTADSVTGALGRVSWSA